MEQRTFTAAGAVMRMPMPEETAVSWLCPSGVSYSHAPPFGDRKNGSCTVSTVGSVVDAENAVNPVVMERP